MAVVQTHPAGHPVPHVAWHPSRYVLAYASTGGTAPGGPKVEPGLNADGLKIVGMSGGVL